MNQNIWLDILPSIKNEVRESSLLTTILSDIKLVDFQNSNEQGHLVLSISDSSFSKKIAETELCPLIERELKKSISVGKIKIEFSVRERQPLEQMSFSIDPETLIQPEVKKSTIEFRPKWFLNPNYKIDYFVNGVYSNFAYQSVLAIAQNNTLNVRQLFIYGDSGLGKTHLLHSLGWEFKDCASQLNVKLFSAEEFINDYHLYLSKKQMPEFRGKYRLNTDVLLIDDIHILAKAKGAQEELFNIFNYYEQTSKLIAFTSDKSPHELSGFEPRLLTRFQGGLTVKLFSPTKEDRFKILNFKQIQKGVLLSFEVLDLISSRIDKSIRSLEGILVSLAYAQNILGRAFTKEEAESYLPKIIESNDKKNVTSEAILAQEANESNISIHEIKSKSRKREHVMVRDKTIFRLRNELNLSYGDIGRLLNRDHSTVMTAYERYCGRMS